MAPKLSLSLFMLASLLSSGAHAEAPACGPIGGLEEIAERPETYLLFGEIHGTVEAPTLFGEIVCHLAKSGRPLMVGLEIFETEQERFDAYFSGPDTEEAREVLTASDIWTNQDGTTSSAVLQLLRRLHELKHAGLPIDVSAISPIFQDWMFKQPDKMVFHKGQGLLRLVDAGLERAGAGARAVTLTGNVHASRPGPDDPAMVQGTFASQLPDGQVISFNVAYAGGEAWNCQQTCGVHSLGGASSDAVPHIALLDAGPHNAPFDGRWYVGAGTAAPPTRCKD